MTTDCVVQGEALTGSISSSGLRNGGRISVVALNSTTWTPLPASPLTARNAISIQNRSGIEIKIQYDPTTAGYVGVVMPDGFERQYDITEAIILYAKAASGTPSVVVEELS